MKRMRLIAYLAITACIFPAVAGSYDDFFRAVHGNDPVTIRELVARGFDPNAPDSRGQPPLLRALHAEADEAALALVRLPGTDVNAQNPSGESGLMMAALKGNLAVCTALLERGAELNRRGWTPLHYAAAGGSLQIVELLLAHGARIDARAPNGRTPLMMAAQSADEHVVAALLAAGANVHARERHDATAADLAGVAGREWLERQLNEHARRTPAAR
jgi:ankyrin repeat protein